MREIDLGFMIGAEEMNQPDWEDFGGSFRPDRNKN